MGEIVTLVLAAHPGDGFERPRWLAPWGDATLLDHVLGELRRMPVEPGVVVLGADAEEVLDGVDPTGFAVVLDPEWDEGEAASIRCGLDFLARRPEVAGVLLVDADDPQPRDDVVSRLLGAHSGSTRPAAVPKYRYTRGRPLVIHRDLWPRLLGMEAGSTIEAFLDTHGELVEEVWVDRVPPHRATTPMDLREMAPRR